MPETRPPNLFHEELMRDFACTVKQTFSAVTARDRKRLPEIRDGRIIMMMKPPLAKPKEEHLEVDPAMFMKRVTQKPEQPLKSCLR